MKKKKTNTQRITELERKMIEAYGNYAENQMVYGEFWKENRHRLLGIELNLDRLQSRQDDMDLEISRMSCELAELKDKKRLNLPKFKKPKYLGVILAVLFIVSTIFTMFWFGHTFFVEDGSCRVLKGSPWWFGPAMITMFSSVMLTLFSIPFIAIETLEEE